MPSPRSGSASRRCIGELIAVEKQWRSLREAHHALSQTLRMFDPDAESYPIKPKRPYRRVLPRGGGKLSLPYHRRLAPFGVPDDDCPR